jgi:hypothetical protein
MTALLEAAVFLLWLGAVLKLGRKVIEYQEKNQP